MVLATGPVWSLSLFPSATYPLATARANVQVGHLRGACAQALLVTSLLAVLFLPLAAHATSGQGLIAMQRWKAMDTCATDAQRAFPDFTPESNARRDANLKDCLARKNLPPREAAPAAR
jgi:hypothetical protein